MPFSYRKLSSGRGLNRNQGGGDKLQGLPPSASMGVYKRRLLRISAGGENRHRFHLGNPSAGGVGRFTQMNSGFGGLNKLRW